jgi:hypothetical protein
MTKIKLNRQNQLDIVLLAGNNILVLKQEKVFKNTKVTMVSFGVQYQLGIVCVPTASHQIQM